MNRTPVSSSNLAAVGYDAGSQRLEVEFHDGSVYCYRGVPASVHKALMSAGSHGSYFSAFIRDQYPTDRVM